MANDPEDQVTHLCTQAAMIMEDVADEALTIGKASAEERTRRLERLSQAASQISKLIAAAVAING